MDTQKAREVAFKILYELEVRGGSASAELFSLHIDEEKLGEKASEFVNWIVSGVCEKNIEFNKIIDQNLKGWKFDRVSKLSLASIKLALFEIENNDKINDSISIAEAVKLTAKYEGEESASFVNGILGNYVRGK